MNAWERVVAKKKSGGGGGGPTSSIAEVASQRASKFANSVDSTTLAFPNNVGNGNLLIIAGSIYDDGAGTSSVVITDTRSTSYSYQYQTIDSQDINFIAYGVTTSSGANTVTVNPQGSDAYLSFVINEYTGQNATPFSAVGSGSNATSRFPSTSVTTVITNELVVGVVNWNFSGGTITPAAGSGYTQIGHQDDSQNGQASSMIHKFATSPGSYSPNWDLTSSKVWYAFAASFK